MSTIQATAAKPSQELLNAVNAKKSTASGIDSVQADTDKFLTLLVTQLKNQDPLNPLDNAQITSQLAQLSTVTGVNRLNTTLETLKTSYQSSEALQSANLIGRDVLAPGNKIELKGGLGTFGIDLASPADSVKVIIRDASGKDIRAIDLGPKPTGTIPLAWDGMMTNSAGERAVAPAGRYSFAVVALRGGEALKDATALSVGRVESVSTSTKDGVKLNVPALGTLTMADVKQIL